MYRLLIVAEKADSNYTAYSPGCVATGKTRDQVTLNILEAIEMHVCGLLEAELLVHISGSFAGYGAVSGAVR